MKLKFKHIKHWRDGLASHHILYDNNQHFFQQLDDLAWYGHDEAIVYTEDRELFWEQMFDTYNILNDIIKTKVKSEP